MLAALLYNSCVLNTKLRINHEDSEPYTNKPRPCHVLSSFFTITSKPIMLCWQKEASENC